MTSDSTFLLRQLSPAVLPASVTAAPPRPSLDGSSFDELLRQARTGAIGSGRQIAVNFRPDESITRSQLDRLAAAADLAEASGARRALLLMDGKGLLLDVPSRTLTGQLQGGAVNVDAALYVGADQRLLSPPGAVAPRGVALAIEAAGRAQMAGAA